jgi:hypothetical protein
MMGGNALKNNFASPAKSLSGKYLFCHFVGNAPEEERIHFALSEDGYNFRPLNKNQPVIIQKYGKQCVRDPYILKGQDGCYYIIGTDMKSDEGWVSNHALVTWKSEDLINWTDETIIDIRNFGDEFANVNRSWAPQAIWDKEKQSYMVYWAISTVENDVAALYYAYTDDFKTLTRPVLLYERQGIQTIDGDIAYNEKNGYYYLYFKEDLTQKIAYVRSKNLTGPYNTDYTVCSLNWFGVEGSTMFRITGTDAYMMIMDEYSEGTFFAQMTRDFENFRQVQRSTYSINHLKPRHGSIAAISEEEYFALIEAYNK